MKIFFIKLIKIINYKLSSDNKKSNKNIIFFCYVLIIFILLTSIYLIIPKYFDYSKKEKVIISALEKNYHLEVIDITNIKYLILPTPRLIIDINKASVGSGTLSINKGNFEILLNPLDVYNYKELKFKKLFLNKADLTIEIKKLTQLMKYLGDLGNIINIKKSNFLINDDTKNLIKIEKIYFSNKNKRNLKFDGELLNRKISINFINQNDRNKLSINIPAIGSSATIFLTKDSNFNISEGTIKSRILKNDIQFDFKKSNNIEIKNSLLRNKFIKTTFDGNIQLNPYFLTKFVFLIKKINPRYLKDFTKRKIILNIPSTFKINKNINGEFKFLYDESVKFKSSYIKEAKSTLILENGEIKFKEIFVKFLDGDLTFSGILKNNEEYERLNFKLILNLVNEKNFLKKLNVSVQKKNYKDKKLDIEGSINLFSNKINFNKISIDNEHLLNKKELDFYKASFEDIVIKGSIINILNHSKIEEFMKIIYNN